MSENKFLEQAHEGKNKWYHYLGTMAISVICGSIAGAIPLLIYSLITGDNLMGPEPQGAIAIFIMLLSFATILVAFIWCVRGIHKKKFLSIITSRPKFAFKRFWVGTGLWALVMIPAIVEMFVSDSFVMQFDLAKFLPLVVVCLIMLPIQTGCEEVLMRGYAMQATYLVSKNKWIAVLVSAILFAVLHGANTEVQAFGVGITMSYFFIMGVFFAILVLLDNGLELAIGAHFANNFLAFTLVSSPHTSFPTAGSLFVDNSPPDMSYWDVAGSALMWVVFIFLAHLIYKFDFKKLFSK